MKRLNCVSYNVYAISIKEPPTALYLCKLVMVSHFDSGYSTRFGVESHWDLNFISLMTNDIEFFFPFAD